MGRDSVFGVMPQGLGWVWDASFPYRDNRAVARVVGQLLRDGVLENTATAPMRGARTAVADGPTKAGKPSPDEQSRTGSAHR